MWQPSNVDRAYGKLPPSPKTLEDLEENKEDVRLAGSSVWTHHERHQHPMVHTVSLIPALWPKHTRSDPYPKYKYALKHAGIQTEA